MEAPGLTIVISLFFRYAIFMVETSRIRNFCIIAHIDHGKSTLADRLIQKGHLIADRDFQNQILDTMDIERERGITIKSQAVTIPYTAADGRDYELNLVDTPGHVDFSYEVSRAISSCEGALLLIDATQGVQAQTLSNMYLALEHDLEIIPVINKIDMMAADIPAAKQQIEHDLGLDPDGALLVSARQGTGVDTLFEAIVTRIPAPAGDKDAPLRALIFDCHYDPYRGVIVHLRIFDGTISPGLKIRFCSNGAGYLVERAGTFKISLVERPELTAGGVGYITAGIKTVSDVRVGDTVTGAENPCAEALPGFREVKPVVFSSIYPLDSNDYEELKTSMEKLKLNDASLLYEKDSSAALGFGFRCGFLGLLHLEVIQERLEREFDQSVIFTAPSVKYRVHLHGGEDMFVDNPADYPGEGRIEHAEEPYIRAAIITPSSFLGNIMTLCTDKRGVQTGMTYLDEKRVEIVYEMPLAEVLFDFYDRLKSLTRGYASFDYDITGYKSTDLVKLDILLNGKPVDALAQLVWKDGAYDRARQVCERLSEEIPRQQFKIPIQGAIGSQIIARETVNALRKDVLAKCYGGDISRKRKLLEKQKEGKKRMKMVGDVELPQSAFLAVLKTKED
ncbi:elongation factor 4 [Spirochaetia bacterium]|nr:elongation factor 4 [Spirochaetia bacterium]GHU34004.1 elongation factor 4 [Spirochaetia bacterium]